MKISKTHQQFSNFLNNPRALDHPEEFLGPNWKDVLNFWFYLDTLSEEQWKIIEHRYCKLDYVARAAAWYAGYDAVRDAAQDAVWFAAWGVPGFGVVAGLAAGYATYELIGSHILLSQDKLLTFLPLFLDVAH